MKYIKTYEGITEGSKYNVGDYILLHNKVSGLDEDKYMIYKNYGYIKYVVIGQMDRIETYMYDVDYIDMLSFKLKNIEQMYIVETDIKRKMTENEILEFDLTVNQNKYNL
jgi:hypothetical protein